MNKLVSSKIVALTFGALVIVFLAAFYAVAVWQEPQEAPPQGNVAAPLNVGTDAQTKEGPLTIANGGGDALILRNGGDLNIYNADNSGSALLYTDNDGELITPGNLRVGNATLKGDGSISTNLNADRLDDYHAADLLAAGGGGAVLITYGHYCAVGSPSAGQNAPACPSGWTPAYTGFSNVYMAGCANAAGFLNTNGINAGPSIQAAGTTYIYAPGNCTLSAAAITCRVCVK